MELNDALVDKLVEVLGAHFEGALASCLQDVFNILHMPLNSNQNNLMNTKANPNNEIDIRSSRKSVEHERLLDPKNSFSRLFDFLILRSPEFCPFSI